MLAYRSPSHFLLQIAEPAARPSKPHSVDVPFTAIKKNTSPSESPSPKAVATPHPHGHGELILLVDDEKSILEILRRTLLSFGYCVVTATDGAEGVRAYAHQMKEIKAVITDMAMPVMDGPALIGALKELNPAVKIIAATGISSNTRLKTIAGLGVDRILSKPFNSRALLSTLRAVLDSE